MSVLSRQGLGVEAMTPGMWIVLIIVVGTAVAVIVDARRKR